MKEVAGDTYSTKFEKELDMFCNAWESRHGETLPIPINGAIRAFRSTLVRAVQRARTPEYVDVYGVDTEPDCCPVPPKRPKCAEQLAFEAGHDFREEGHDSREEGHDSRKGQSTARAERENSNQQGSPRRRANPLQTPTSRDVVGGVAFCASRAPLADARDENLADLLDMANTTAGSEAETQSSVGQKAQGRAEAHAAAQLARREEAFAARNAKAAEKAGKDAARAEKADQKAAARTAKAAEKSQAAKKKAEKNAPQKKAGKPVKVCSPTTQLDLDLDLNLDLNLNRHCG